MTLADHPFFNAFAPAIAEQLAASATTDTYPAGYSLFEDGAASDCVYLVLSGEVELTKPIPGDKDRVLARVGEGAFFGEMGVFDGEPRSTGARIGAEATLSRIERAPLLATLEDGPGRTVIELLHRVLANLRASNDRYIADVVRKEKMTLVGEMAGSIIHDLRGPFTAIELAASLLERSHPEPSTKELLGMMRAQVMRANAMVEELLEFSRGQSNLKLEISFVDALLEQFRALNEESWKTRKPKVILEGEPIAIMADPFKFLRVLQNLVNNSLDALQDREDGWVKVTSYREGALARIDVQDNGNGIPEAIRARMFEPFVTHGKRGGTGLGMAITRSIVQAHNGQITFVTETGVGTTFQLSFPVLG